MRGVFFLYNEIMYVVAQLFLFFVFVMFNVPYRKAVLCLVLRPFCLFVRSVSFTPMPVRYPAISY